MVLRCPYCLDDLLPEDVVVRCGSCRTPHHRACFRENEGCTSIGCDGVAEVDAGPSLYIRPALKVGILAGQEVAFGPFKLVWRRLATAARSPGTRIPRPWCRLSMDGTELREGESMRGRAVLHLPQATRIRQLELRLSQGLRAPVPLAEVQLVALRGWFAAPLSLSAGSHPFELELRAPPITPHVDPFQLELSCTRGVMEERLLSERLPLFLLQRPLLRPPEERPEPRPAAASAVRLPAPQVALHPQGPAAPAPPIPPPVHAPEPFDPFSGPPLPPWDPFASGSPALGADAWRNLGLRQRGNGAHPRTIPVRFAVPPGRPGPTLELHAPERVTSRELPVAISGGGPFLSLNLAVQVELVRPGGVPVPVAGLPATEEVRLLGHDALDARRYGPEGLELLLEIAPQHLEALRQARAGGLAHNAALRLHLALDGLGADGRVRASASRAVTVLPARD